MSEAYPVNLTIDYPDRKLNKLTTFFRIFMVIPIYILFLLLVGATYTYASNGNAGSIATGFGFLVLPLVFMILFRRKYPQWWYDWNLNLLKFSVRISSYLYLLTDIYPSTDEDQSVHIELPYPDAAQLNRWLPLVKWILAIPAVIVLVFLAIATFIVVIIAWFAILFTGMYPRSLFDFVVDVFRWNIRISAYALLLTTDKYPPFRLGV
jgi:hypothetical protein